ncbi:MAG: FeoB-associated Cys-rich membrane protein [Cyclobacteriaceae bacterium]
MLQNILIILVFACALGYLTRLTWRSFQHRGQCQSGCGKCAATTDRLEKV